MLETIGFEDIRIFIWNILELIGFLVPCKNFTVTYLLLRDHLKPKVFTFLIFMKKSLVVDPHG